MTQIFVLPLTEAEKLSEAVLARFPLRRARAERIRSRDGQLHCLGAGALLGQVLHLDEEKIEIDRFGKPYAPQLERQFNLSHSGGYVVLAVSEGAVGVDVQQLGAVRSGVARRCFTADEQAWAAQNEERFFTVWTLKESVVKAVGLGLRLKLNSFSVLPLLRANSIAVEGVTLYGQTLSLPGHALSVVSAQPFDSAVEPIFVTAEELE